jgi:hypothetical protein
MSPNAGMGLRGSQPMSTAVNKSPNKLWRSKSIFNLRMGGLVGSASACYCYTEKEETTYALYAN